MWDYEQDLDFIRCLLTMAGTLSILYHHHKILDNDLQVLIDHEEDLPYILCQIRIFCENYEAINDKTIFEEVFRVAITFVYASEKETSSLFSYSI